MVTAPLIVSHPPLKRIQYGTTRNWAEKASWRPSSRLFTIITSDNPRDEEPLDIINDIKTGIGKTDGKYIEIPDRKEAIKYAILNGKKGDVIVLAGKGHEDYQEIKGVKHHMDERDLIREILEEEDVTKICGYNNRYFA